MNTNDKAALLENIKREIRENLDMSRGVTDEYVNDIVTEKVFQESSKHYMSLSDRQYIIANIFNSIRKLDVLQPLIDDKEITEIMINGPYSIFIEKKGKIYEVDTTFESSMKLEDVIQSIVAKVNRSVNELSPIVDARLGDGSRVNIVLHPIALNGPIVTIRKFPEKPIDIRDLIAWGSISEEAAEFLQRLVRAKYNIFICGGTGSGKTSFLNALSSLYRRMNG